MVAGMALAWFIPAYGVLGLLTALPLAATWASGAWLLARPHTSPAARVATPPAPATA
jgi:hypothetical protein